MRYLFTFLAFCFSIKAMSQDSVDVQKLLRTFKELEVQKLPTGSIKRLEVPQYINNIPNAFTGKLPEPKYIVSNGKGQDIYILPVDNMPMIKPDNTYHSNMPTGIWRKR